MDDTTLKKELQRTILDLIEDLKNNVFSSQTNKTELAIVELFFRKQHPNKLMNMIIEKVLPFKNKIQSRDRDFFVNNKTIFSGLPSARVDYYINYITDSSKMSQENIDVVWQYFDLLIILSEKYKKVK